jgi:hypothetical protein
LASWAYAGIHLWDVHRSRQVGWINATNVYWGQFRELDHQLSLILSEGDRVRIVEIDVDDAGQLHPGTPSELIVPFHSQCGSEGHLGTDGNTLLVNGPDNSACVFQLESED